MFQDCFKGRRILVTGHTGFKGAWLCEWLLSLEAHVVGYALAPPSQPALFDVLELAKRVEDIRGDLFDYRKLADVVRVTRPEFVFHLAAQSLVRASYSDPVETYRTNVLGTVHLLDALRAIDDPCVAILVTSDKCYENREQSEGYREQDRLGGIDPYSCSKAMCELAIDSYRRAFFHNHPVKLASVRAGNVIGGGDWAIDRIVPDCIRSLTAGVPIVVRNPKSTRPWQHVLEPLGGYLTLASQIHQATNDDVRQALCSPFNFGPHRDSHRTVQSLVEEVLKHWPGAWQDQSQPNAPHEARLLSLDTNKALQTLGWRSRWNFEETVQATIHWYQQYSLGGDMRSITRAQIDNYSGR